MVAPRNRTQRLRVLASKAQTARVMPKCFHGASDAFESDHDNRTTKRSAGMTCGGCVAKVKHALSSVMGVHVVDVSLPKHTATVEVDDAKSSDAMREAVRSAGYDIVDSPVMTKSGGCCCS